MAASATRDLLQTTDTLFNKSEALNAELTRLVRAVQGRKALGEAAEIVRLASAGIDASCLQQLSAGSGAASPASEGSPAAGPSVLEAALADCRTATAAIASLHESRNSIVDARAEAISRQEGVAEASRAQLLAELKAGSSLTDETYLRKLREIVAASGSSSGSSS